MRHRYLTIGGSGGRISLAALAGLAVCGLALTGCGGGQPAGSAAGRPLAQGQVSAGQASAADQAHWPADRKLTGIHACALIPAAMIAQTLGQLEEPPGESPDGLTCFYNTRASSESAGPSYILDVLKRSAYELAKTVAGGEAQGRLLHLATVSGVGDEGFATSGSAGGPFYNVSVARGGAAAAIQVNSVTSADERRADHLVASAITRL